MGGPDTKKLSTYEFMALSSPFDLAAAYPRQSFTKAQQQIVKNLAQLYSDSHSMDELRAKKRFEDAFFALAGQTSVSRLDAPLANYSGSIAIEIMANYLRLNSKSVTLMQPTFDALADTLKRHRIKLEPIDEDAALSLTPASPRIKTDALYIVCPNNPTGRCPSQKEFTDIVGYCKKYNILLIIDFCFRFYGDFWHYDQYQIMQDAGIDFIATEDTGKTWPSAEIKLGMVLCSPALYQDMMTVSHDFLVGVSPFVFELMRSYVELEDSGKCCIVSQETADTNRLVLRKLLRNTPLTCPEVPPKISMEWVRLPSDWSADNFSTWLHDRGIQVLPGELFYWHNHKRGQNFIRVALLRKPDYFHDAAQLLALLSAKYRPEVRSQIASVSQKTAASSLHNLG